MRRGFKQIMQKAQRSMVLWREKYFGPRVHLLGVFGEHRSQGTQGLDKAHGNATRKQSSGRKKGRVPLPTCCAVLL